MEAGKYGEACSEVERSAGNTDGDVSQIPFVPNGKKGRTTKLLLLLLLLLLQQEQAGENFMNSSLQNFNLHIITSRGTSNIILSVLLSNQAQQQVSVSKQCASHVSDFRPRWATPPWLSVPSVYQTLTLLCISRLFIGAHAIYLQIPMLHNDTRSSRRLFVNTVLNYRVPQKAEFLEYLNDYELLEDSPPSLQPFPNVP